MEQQPNRSLHTVSPVMCRMTSEWYMLTSITLPIADLPGWVKTAGVRCGTGKWFKDKAKDTAKTYDVTVTDCAAWCTQTKSAGSVAFDIHNGASGYCNLFTQAECSNFGTNSAYDAYTWRPDPPRTRSSPAS